MFNTSVIPSVTAKHPRGRTSASWPRGDRRLRRLTRPAITRIRSIVMTPQSRAHHHGLTNERVARHTLEQEPGEVAAHNVASRGLALT